MRVKISLNIKNITLSFIATILVAFIFISACEAANWYVDNSVGSSGNGQSWATAWKQFSNINWASVSAGDTIYISGGSASKTYTGQLSIGKSGTAGNPITITIGAASPSPSGHDGQVIIDGQGTETGGNIRGNGYNYIIVDGYRGSAVDGDYTYGLRSINPAANGYVYYDYDSPHDVKVTHIEGYGTTTGASDDNRGGILIANDTYNIEISYCWIHGPVKVYVDRAQRWDATGMTVWNVLSGTTFTRVKLHHNKVEQVLNDGIRGSNNCSLYNNDVRNVDGTGHSDSLLIQSGSYAKVYNNYVESNDQAIYLDNLSTSTKSNVWIYNNAIVGTHPAGSSGLSHFINLDPESGNWDTIYIMNNTFWNAGGGLYVIRGNGRGFNQVTNLMIKNNILCSSGELPIVLVSSNTFLDANALDYNLYMLANGSEIVAWTDGSNKTLTQLRALSPARETNGAYGTPTFVSTTVDAWNLHLVASDTMVINKGADLKTYFTTDKDGVSRPQGSAWDIGAYEGPGDTVPPSAPRNLRIIP